MRSMTSLASCGRRINGYDLRFFKMPTVPDAGTFILIFLAAVFIVFKPCKVRGFLFFNFILLRFLARLFCACVTR